MYGCPNTRDPRRGRERWFVAGLALTCLVASAVWFFGVNHSTIEAWATLPQPHVALQSFPALGYRPESELDVNTIGWDGGSISVVLGEPVEGVRARGFLLTVAHVHDGDAKPVEGARVEFTLSSESGQATGVDYTDAQGSASWTGWIPADAKGEPMIANAKATYQGWTGTSSKWFVPE